MKQCPFCGYDYETHEGNKPFICCVQYGIADGLRRGTLRTEPAFIQDPVKGWRLVEVSIVRNEQ